MKIPNSVKIGAFNYPVTYDESDRLQHQSLGGQIDYSLKKIYLNNKEHYSKEYIENVFIHEVLHGIIYEAGLEETENNVLIIGNMLYQVLKENPNVFNSEEE